MPRQSCSEKEKLQEKSFSLQLYGARPSVLCISWLCVTPVVSFFQPGLSFSSLRLLLNCSSYPESLFLPFNFSVIWYTPVSSTGQGFMSLLLAVKAGFYLGSAQRQIIFLISDMYLGMEEVSFWRAPEPPNPPALLWGEFKGSFPLAQCNSDEAKKGSRNPTPFPTACWIFSRWDTLTSSLVPPAIKHINVLLVRLLLWW